MPIFFLTLLDRESSFKYFRAQGSETPPTLGPARPASGRNPLFPCQPHLSSRKITPFSASVIRHGGDSSFPRRRQEAALFQRGGRGFAPRRRQALHRARRVLRSEGAGGPRVAAFRDRPPDVLARQGRAVEPGGGAPAEGLQGAG